MKKLATMSLILADPTVARIVDLTMADIESLPVRHITDQLAVIDAVNAELQSIIGRVQRGVEFQNIPVPPNTSREARRLRTELPAHLQEGVIDLIDGLVLNLKEVGGNDRQEFLRIARAVSMALIGATQVMLDKAKPNATLLLLGGLTVVGVTAAVIEWFFHRKGKVKKAKIKRKKNEEAETSEETAPDP